MYSSKANPKLLDNFPAREPSVRFVIVGNPRTGSSHLVSLLDSHPDIGCWDDEIFDLGQAFDRSSYRDPIEFLQEMVFAVKAAAVGFKLLRDAFEHVGNAWHWIKELDLKLVQTYRANLLDSYISYKLASINNAFTCWYGDYRINRFEANFAECLHWFELSANWDAYIYRSCVARDIPRIAIEYNELCETVERVVQFVGATSHPLVSQLRKQRSGSQAEIITNYVSLKEKFASSKWSKHFDC
jgi:hypothetical protein